MRVNPYSQGDGWYGYTNPHRFIEWFPKKEDAVAEKEEGKEDESGVATAPAQSLSLAHLEEELTNTQAVFTFELQEYKQQADLWQEAVMKTLMQHMPGELPPSADILASLEMLMDAWAHELDQQRASAIAAHFSLPPISISHAPVSCQQTWMPPSTTSENTAPTIPTPSSPRIGTTPSVSILIAS